MTTSDTPAPLRAGDILPGEIIIIEGRNGGRAPRAVQALADTAEGSSCFWYLAAGPVQGHPFVREHLSWKDTQGEPPLFTLRRPTAADEEIVGQLMKAIEEREAALNHEWGALQKLRAALVPQQQPKRKRA